MLIAPNVATFLPYLLSFHSLWAVLGMALLKRLAFPCAVLIRNKRGCKTQGGQAGTTAVLSFCLSPLHFSFSPLHCTELRGLRFIFLTFTHPSSVSLLFFFPSSSTCMHCGSHVSIAHPRVFIWHTWLPCWLWSSDLCIKGPFTCSPGGGDRNICVFLLCAWERKAERAQDAISGEWELTEAVIQYFPLWDFWLVSLFSHSVTCVTWM